MQRDSFLIYRSFVESINNLPEHLQLPLYKAISNYGLDQQDPDFGTSPDSYILRALWITFKPLLDKNYQRWQHSLGGGPPKGSHNNPNGRRGKGTNQELTENLPNVNVKVNVDEKVNDNDNAVIIADAPTPKKKGTSFVAPSLDEVKAYAVERGEPEDEALAFYDYELSAGWMLSGGRKVVDWRAAFRTWIRKAKTRFQTSKPSKSSTNSRTEIPHAGPGEFKNTLM